MRAIDVFGLVNSYRNLNWTLNTPSEEIPTMPDDSRRRAF